MRRLLVLMVLLPACREPAHISVKLEMSCNPEPTTGIPMPQRCDDMLLYCANFVEARIYEADGDRIGNILSSKCIPIAELGTSRLNNLCDLQAQQSTLIESLPEGKTVRLRLRALFVLNERNGCNDDIPGQVAPTPIFDGFSLPVPIDRASHEATIAIGTCGSCNNLPTACPNLSCPPIVCGPGMVPAAYPGSPDCCPVTCKLCDPAVDPTCEMQPACTNPGCPPPSACPDGSMPTPFPGDCCLRCRDPNQPPMMRPDGGVMPN